jgi:serpin B
LSIAAVLGMILKALPHGEPKQKMLACLHLNDLKESRVHAALSACCSEMNSASANTKVCTANGMAIARNDLNPSYVSTVRNIYKGEIFTVGKDAINIINKWASDKTMGMIPKLLGDDTPMEDLAAVLLNAIYFSAEWEIPFSPKKTSMREFLCADGTKFQAKFMSHMYDEKFMQGEGFKMLEKSYLSPEGQKLSQIMFLPNDPNNLNAMQASLNPEMIKKCRECATETEVSMLIPKLESEYEINLLEVFRSMGMPVDEKLSTLHPKAKLAWIIHKTKMSQDEIGTRAAGATAGGVRCESVSMPKMFHATHSYAFYIMAGDMILFQGQVKDAKVLTKESVSSKSMASMFADNKHVFEKILSPEEATILIKVDRDFSSIMDLLRSDRAYLKTQPLSSKVAMVKNLDGTVTRFDIVNFTNHTVSFDAQRCFTIDGQKVVFETKIKNFEMVYTPNDSQIVIMKDAKGEFTMVTLDQNMRMPDLCIFRKLETGNYKMLKGLIGHEES